MLQEELSSDMDRITQLQDAIEALLTITTSSIAYLTRKTTFKPFDESGNDVPVTFKSDDAEPGGKDAFEANKKELVEDVTRKAKQVERLIQALPDVEDTEVKAERLQALQLEMDEANEEYKEAVRVAESLLAEVNLVLRETLGSTSSRSAHVVPSMIDENKMDEG